MTEQHSSPKVPVAEACPLSFQMFRLLIKKEGMLHSGQHGPLPTFEMCCCHQFQDEQIFFYGTVVRLPPNLCFLVFSLLLC